MDTSLPHATLLLQADVGRAQDVARWVRDLPSVTTTVVTSGPYDVIAVVALGDLQQVLGRTRLAPGLARLRVCRPPELAAG